MGDGAYLYSALCNVVKVYSISYTGAYGFQEIITGDLTVNNRLSIA
jgi:hypothetical protein